MKLYMIFKFDIIKGNISALVTFEQKIYYIFPELQIYMSRLAGYYRLHRSSIGGGISMSVREEIWSKLSETTFTNKRFGGEIIT